MTTDLEVFQGCWVFLVHIYGHIILFGIKKYSEAKSNRTELWSTQKSHPCRDVWVVLTRKAVLTL